MSDLTLVSCPQCGNSTYVNFSQIVDCEKDHEYRQQLINGSLNYANCPHCGHESGVSNPFMVIDPIKKQVIFVIPDHEEKSDWEMIFKNVLKTYSKQEEYFRTPKQVGRFEEMVNCLQKEDESTVEDFLPCLERFLLASTWDERKWLVSHHPEIMNDKPLIFLTQQIQLARQQENIEHIRLVVLGRNILDLCSFRNIDEAISKLSRLIHLSQDGNGNLVMEFPRNNIEEIEQLEIDILDSIIQASRYDYIRLPYIIERLKDALISPTFESEPEVYAQILASLGSAYRRLPTGDTAQSLREAIRYMKEAQSFYEGQNICDEVYLTTLNELGLTYMDLPGGDQGANLNQAVAYFEKALQVENIVSFPGVIAMSYNNLGMAYSRYKTPDWYNALSASVGYFRKALEFYTPDEKPEEYAMAMTNLGTVHLQLMDIDSEHADQALNCFREILTIWQADGQSEHDASLLARCYVNCTFAALNSQTREEGKNQRVALEYAQTALDLLQDGPFPNYSAIAHEAMAAAYGAAGSSQNLNSQIEHLNLALSGIKLNTYPVEFMRIQKQFGNCYLQVSDWKNAERCYEKAIMAHESLFLAAGYDNSRYGQTSTASDLYTCSAYALARMGLVEQAFLRLENGKTKVIAHYLNTGSQALDTLSDDERELYEELQEKIRWQEQQLKENDRCWNVSMLTMTHDKFNEANEELSLLRQRMQELIDQIRERDPSFLRWHQSLKNILTAIPSGGVVVVPMFTHIGSACFIVPSGERQVRSQHLIWLDDITSTTIDEILGGTKDSSNKANWFSTYHKRPHQYQFIRSIGKRLWETILGPLHARLAEMDISTGSPVLIIPQRGVGLLPLHASWRIENGSYRYFIDDWEVSYSPSLQIASVSEKRSQHFVKGKEASLFTVVDTRKDLTFALEEDRAIGVFFEKHERLIGDDATLDQVKKVVGRYDYLHFACHGFYDFQNPFRSGLAMAGEEILDVQELMQEVDLSKSRLTTLSACQTGVIDIVLSPDEYLGLSAGFLVAGTAAVLNTLWPVNDLSTMLIMSRFYEGHVRYGLQPASALREAQRWLRSLSQREVNLRLADFIPDIENNSSRRMMDNKPFEHPYYWAGFTLYGC